MASVGENTVAIFGRTTVDAASLARRLETMRAVGDLDSVARTLPGCVHLLASFGGHVRAQGSLSTARQVFYSSVDGVTVAADRPQILAALANATVDEELVVLHLFPFGAPWPLNDRCLWHGVKPLATGHYLEIRSDGAGKARRWWAPPAPEIPLAAGATMLRDALLDAVRARTSRRGSVSADLSGGADSMTLCFAAASTDTRLVTVRYQALDSANDDEVWGGLCEAALPTAQHVIVPRDTAPAWYAEPATVNDDPEGPLPVFRSRATTQHLAELVSGMGSTLHLQGVGGDELFHPSALCLHAFVREHPIRAVPHIRAAKARARWTTVGTVRSLLNNPSYPRWLASCARRLTMPRTSGTPIGWEFPPAMPSWATPTAIATARRLLLDAATSRPRPLSPLPVQHEMIRATQLNGAVMRRNSRITESFGVTLEAPYLDDRVLETALSIRLEDRMAVGRYKPALTAAAQGIVPAHLLGRRTKGDYSAEFYAGLNSCRRELLDRFDNSHLVRMGLVDPAVLRTALLGLHPDTGPLMPVDSTLACEHWLHSLPFGLRTTDPGAPPVTPQGA